MSLTVEDGSGVVGAESYASEAAADSYWGSRTHTAFYTAWNAATQAKKEGALREATGYADAMFGPFYRGVRRGYAQGLLWPRTGAKDDEGFDLPDLPQELITAVCELAGRAISERLAPDLQTSGAGAVKRQKVDTIEREFFEGSPGKVSEKVYGAVGGTLAPILTGGQPGARGISWNWR